MPVTSRYTPLDDLFHQPRVGEPEWLETNWFSFLVPERAMVGHIYAGFRLNLGVVFSEVMIYSRGAKSKGEYDYYDSRIHLPLPDANLDSYRLRNGLAVQVLEPLKTYGIRYEGLHDTSLDLRLTGLTVPVDSADTRLPGGADFSHFHVVRANSEGVGGHIDQSMMIEGELRLAGELIKIAHPANRDHSWGPRPEFGHGRGNFDEGFFGTEFGFHVQTTNTSHDKGIVTNGYVFERGEVLALKAGEGRYKVDGWGITELEYELEDELSRTHVFRGESMYVSIVDTFPNQFNTAGPVKWATNGDTGYGEYKWHWETSQAILHAER
jgi:hypothetical protein